MAVCDTLSVEDTKGAHRRFCEAVGGYMTGEQGAFLIVAAIMVIIIIGLLTVGRMK